MRLEFQYYEVSHVTFGSSTKYDRGTLTIHKQELVDHIAADKRLASVDVEIVSPGSATRISNVLDAIEPRMKVDTGCYFPGMLDDIIRAGGGATNVLRGAAVLEIGSAAGIYGGVLDMTGPGAELSALSKMHNICVIVRPEAGLTVSEFAQALKKASMRASVYVAAATRGATPSSTETFALDLQSVGSTSPAHVLPRIAYLLHLNSVGDLRQPYIYGDNPPRWYPTILHPNEVIDGAIVCGHYNLSVATKNLTYAFLNNPVILELYRRHGTELDFRGVVIAPEPVSLSDMRRTAMVAAGLLKETLGADGVIMTKEAGGHTDVVLMESCEACEKLGVRTVLIDNEWLGPEGTDDIPLIAFSDVADAIVSVGNMEAMVDLPAFDQVVGGDSLPGFDIDLHEAVRIPIMSIPLAISQLGLTHLRTERR